VSTCVDCQDDQAVARQRCDTCYRRARRSGVIGSLWRPVSDAEVQRMRQLRSRGLSLAAVADVVGRGVSTVYRHTA